LSGHWEDRYFDLSGGASANHNHAKVGVSTSGEAPLVIFGDMNQQGSVSNAAQSLSQEPSCARSQNGRGGLFFVVEDRILHDSVRDLIDGQTAPTAPPSP
jgi:hypothetical protein